MAIPIRDIPNAPQILPEGPIATPSVSAGETGAVFGRLAQGLQQPTIQQGSLDGPAEGLQSIAKGIGEAGGVADHLAQKAGEERVNYQTNEGQDKITAAFEAYKASLPPGTDPAEILPGWEKQRQGVIDGVLADKSLAPDARMNLEHFASHFTGRASSELNTFALKTTFERSKNSLLQRANDQLDAGDLDGFKSTAEQLRTRQLEFPEAVDEFIKNGERKHELIQTSRAIDADPKAALEQIAALKPGENTKLSVEQIEKLHDQAATQFQSQRTKLFTKVHQMAEANLLTGKEQIEKLGKGYFDPNDVAILDARRGKDADPDYATWHAVMTDAAAYDPAKDKTGEKLHSILAGIHSLPEGWRADVRNALTKAEDGTRPSNDLRGEIAGRINALVSAGMFGDVRKQDGAPVNTVEFGKAYETAARLQNGLNVFLRTHPQASFDDANGWFQSNVQGKVLVQPPHDWHFWNPWSWPAPPRVPADSLLPPGSATDAAADPRRAAVAKVGDVIAKARGGAGSAKGAGLLDEDFVSKVKEWEDFTPVAKPDGHQMSVGYGTRAAYAGQRLSREEADAALRGELEKHAQNVDAAIAQHGWRLTRAQRNALVSFDFNTGAGAQVLAGSNGIAALKSKMAEYTKTTVGGQKVQSGGLVNRRRFELEMFGS